jgi:hypothetical protein
LNLEHRKKKKKKKIREKKKEKCEENQKIVLVFNASRYDFGVLCPPKIIRPCN